MWDYVYTEGMRQRGTLRPLNKLALLQSSAWIVPKITNLDNIFVYAWAD